MRQEEGRSIKEIARLLGVARSTVSLWVRDIELSPQQHAALRERNPAYNGQRNGSEATIAKGRERRQRYQELGRSLARRGDRRYAAGCMLYWGEGAKSRNQLRIANSDPALIAFFVNFLREYFSVPDSSLRIKCHLFADHRSSWDNPIAMRAIYVDRPTTCWLTAYRRLMPCRHCQEVTLKSTAFVQEACG